MPWSKSQKGSDQLKVDVGLISLVVEPVEPSIRVVHEHTVVSVEQLLEHELEVFLFDSSFVNCWFILEMDP
jgi:hypothetical protein